jgi:hypothetical protein
MQWVHVHIPRQVADEVGATAVRSGIARDQAIAAALWVFSRLSVAERAALIRTYLADRAAESPAAGQQSGA